MKNLLLIIFLLPFMVYSQDIPKEYRDHNTVVIQSELEGEDLILELGAVLIEKGFLIDKFDKDFFTISTEPMNISPMKLIIKAKANGNKLEIQHFTSMDIQVGGVRNDGFDLTNFRPGMKGSPKSKAFIKLNEVLNLIEGERIYLKK